MNKKKLVFLIKKLFCAFFLYSGICRLFAFIHKNEVKILLYHGILDAPLPEGLNNDDLHIPRESFQKQVAYLRRHYHIFGLDEFVGYLKSGRPFPEYSVVITFDDGYKNTYKNLKGMLSGYRFPVTIFLVSDYVGSSELLWLDKLEMAFFNTRRKGVSSLEPIGLGKFEWADDKEKMEKYLILKNRLKKLSYDRLEETLSVIFSELGKDAQDDSRSEPGFAYTRIMNWEEARELEDYGVRFGSHSCRHEILTALTQDRMEETLRNSLAAIRSNLAQRDIPLAYPNGNFNDGVKKASENTGYSCGLTTVHGFNSSGADLYSLRRNEVGCKGDMHIFIASLSGVLDFIKLLAGR